MRRFALAIAASTIMATAALPVDAMKLSDNGLSEAEAITVSGYALPVDYEGDTVYAFMLVSRPGACSHQSQPPPRQMVLVTPDKPWTMTRIYEPVEIAGMLVARDEQTQTYVLDGVMTLKSAWRMRGANVVRGTAAPVAPQAKNPWARLHSTP